MEPVCIPDKISTSKLTVLSSKFLGYLIPITSLQELETHLISIKKEHPKANHFCYAYRLGKPEIQAFATDAGEPSGSAGKPILGVLSKHQLTDTMLVVVRYFGGKKLGVRGLINAYGQTALQSVEQAAIHRYAPHVCYDITLHYSDQSQFEHELSRRDGLLQQASYDDRVHLKVAFPTEYHSQIKAWLEQLVHQGILHQSQFQGESWIACGLKQKGHVS